MTSATPTKLSKLPVLVSSWLRTLTLPISSALLLASNASADEASPDAQALAAAHEAMTEDYLASRFDVAEQKLSRAVADCQNRCSAQVLALLHRDLGVVYIGSGRRPDEGMAELIQALGLDPNLALEDDFKNEAIARAFAEAKASMPASEPEAAKAAANASPPSEMAHVPPPEQTRSTPLPLYAAPASGSDFARVKVRYRAFGEAEWQSVELPRMGAGFGGEVPCDDLGTTGELQYYIQGYDASGDIEAISGSRQRPHRVLIVHRLRGAPPALPGKPPPAACREASDCPPDFPGCSSSQATLPEPRLRPIVRQPAKNWFSFGVQQDFMLVGAASGVCQSGSDYECFEADDVPFEGAPPTEDAAGQVVSGILPARTRLLAGYDRLFLGRLTAGARLGIAFGGGPDLRDGGDFVPVHAELRAALWFGAHPFLTAGFRPFVQVSGGVAQAEARVEVNVFENQAALDRGDVSQVDAVRRTGVGFLSAGVGTVFAVERDHGVVAELRFSQNLGISASTLALGVGYTYGF